MWSWWTLLFTRPLALRSNKDISKLHFTSTTTDHLPCRTLSCEQVFLYLNVNLLHMFLLSPVYAPLQARAPRLVCTKLRDRRRRGCPRVTEQSRPVCPLRKYPFCHRQNAARTTRSPWTPSIRQSLFNGHQLSFFAK